MYPMNSSGPLSDPTLSPRPISTGSKYSTKTIRVLSAALPGYQPRSPSTSEYTKDRPFRHCSSSPAWTQRLQICRHRIHGHYFMRTIYSSLTVSGKTSKTIHTESAPLPDPCYHQYRRYRPEEGHPIQIPRIHPLSRWRQPHRCQVPSQCCLAEMAPSHRRLLRKKHAQKSQGKDL